MTLELSERSTAYVYPVLLAIVVVSTVGDYFLKRSAMLNDFTHPFAAAGFLLYAFTAFGWLYIMQFRSLDVIAALYSATTIITLTLMGWFVFKEAILPKNIIALLLAFGAIAAAESDFWLPWFRRITAL